MTTVSSQDVNDRQTPERQRLLIHLHQKSHWLFLSLLVLAGCIAFFDTGESFEQPYLLLTLNTFFFLISLVVSTQFTLSFLEDGSPCFLLLTCGVLTWGIAGFFGVVAGILPSFSGQFNANALITIHNISMWLSAMCHLCAIILTSVMPQKTTISRTGWTLSAYLGVLFVSIVIVIATTRGLTPLFFIPGSGATIVRQFVVASSIAMYLLTAIFLRMRTDKATFFLALWYEYALLLMASGLFCHWLQQNSGGALSWYGRVLQYLGGLAILTTALLAKRGMKWSFIPQTGENEKIESVNQLIQVVAISAVSVLATGAVQLLILEPADPRFDFLTFLPAVMFAVLLGGKNSGILSFLLSCGLVIFSHYGIKRGTFSPELHVELIRFGIFLWTSFCVTLLVKTLQHTRNEVIAAKINMRHLAQHQQDAHALKSGEELLQNVIEGTNAGIWDWNVQTGETVFNERWAQIIGYSLKDLAPIGIKTWKNLVHPEDLEHSNEQLLRVFAGELAIYDCECRMRHRDGTWIWVHDRGKVVAWNRDGSPLRMIGSHTDITARKKIETELQENERNFRNIIETTSDLIVVATVDGKILFANSKFTEKLGFTEEELVDMPLLDLHPPELRPEAIKIFTSMLQGERNICPLPIMSKNGGIIPVETRVWRGTWSRINCIYGFIRDLTADQEEKQRFESLFRRNPAVMAITSRQDRVFIDINDSFVETLGYSRQEVLGKTVEELGLFIELDQYLKSRNELIREKMIKGHVHLVRHKNGSILHGLFSVEVVHTQNSQYHITVMIDLTTRVQMEREVFLAKEKAETADAEKSRLLSVIAHEFRTPLALLNSSLDILERYKERLNDQDRHTQDNHIRSALSQLKSLVDVSQSYNWVQSDPAQARLAEMDIEQFFQAVASEVQIVWASTHVFTLHIESVLPDFRSDEALLRSILVNLLANAFQYTPAGGMVSLLVAYQEEALRIIVEDTGFGIPKDELKSIFNPFTRGSNISSKRGMGLGLNIVSIALEKLHGKLEVISKEGTGTKITLYLPIL